MATYSVEHIQQQIKYLKLLATHYPTVQSACTEIINLQAILQLPKGTEHFMSDIHGEYEAFYHIFNNCSGVIKEKIDTLLSNSVSDADRAQLATLIYYPQLKLKDIRKSESNYEGWCRLTLYRLIDVCRAVSVKYTRSKVRKALPADYSYIIDELLHADYSEHNKDRYYRQIVDTILSLDRADAFIIALSTLIKQLAVDHLHILGDLFDRGQRPDLVLDLLTAHHSTDIQWGNHDVLWM
ncbi:MAG: fructose-bisphosphatase class III, partial [Clostridia bacterium]|nr:fructose-bisphosphatase class III [Clostridia bacterium]